MQFLLSIAGYLQGHVFMFLRLELFTFSTVERTLSNHGNKNRLPANMLSQSVKENAKMKISC